MKENIIKIIDKLSDREYFNDCSVSLNINYNEVVGRRFDLTSKQFTNCMFKNSIDELKEVISNFSGDILGYNLSLNYERGVNSCSGSYEKDWKSVTTTLWSGNDGDGDGDEKINNIDILRYGMFEWIFLSDMEDYGPSGIRSKLSKIVYDDDIYIYDDDDDDDDDDDIYDDDYGTKVFGNYFEYDNVGHVIDSLIELDFLIDKQYKEKCEIYDKLKLYL